MSYCDLNVFNNIAKKEEQKIVNGWNTGLPKEQGIYLVTLNDGEVTILTYREGSWSGYFASGFGILAKDEVVAWEPLPEPYKG